MSQTNHPTFPFNLDVLGIQGFFLPYTFLGTPFFPFRVTTVWPLIASVVFRPSSWFSHCFVASLRGHSLVNLAEKNNLNQNWTWRHGNWRAPCVGVFFLILLMDKILHHLGWLKPYKWWDNHHPWWCRILSISSMLEFLSRGLLPWLWLETASIPGKHPRCVLH